jgi:GTP-binding protein EngB required for normal cell division
LNSNVAIVLVCDNLIAASGIPLGSSFALGVIRIDDIRAAASRKLIDRVHRLFETVEPLIPNMHRDVFTTGRERLHAPLTVALIGRAKIGKSTLLNALVGDHVAATNATECTKVVTLYRDMSYEEGSTQRVDVFGIDSNSPPRRISGILPIDFGMPADTIDYAVAYHPSDLLGEYNVIDTPGLSKHDSIAQEATRRALLDPSRGLPQPDVLLFLVDCSGLHGDEESFLNEVRATRRNTMFVLAGADRIGKGPFEKKDPFDLAHVIAGEFAKQFATTAMKVVPVSGKLAEAGVLGVSSEDVRAIAGLPQMTPDELKTAIDGRGCGNSKSLGDVYDLVGEYGIVRGREHAEHGAVSFQRWAIERSGIEELNNAIKACFLSCSHALKARTAINLLRDITHGPDASNIKNAIEAAELDAALHPVRELGAVEGLSRWNPTHPLIAEFDHISTAPDSATIVGLPAGSAPGEIIRAADQRIAVCQERQGRSRGAAEQNALAVLARSYRLIQRGVRDG